MAAMVDGLLIRRLSIGFGIVPHRLSAPARIILPCHAMFLFESVCRFFAFRYVCTCLRPTCFPHTLGNQHCVLDVCTADPCDTTVLITSADSMGDCTATLSSGESCTQTGAGFTCTASSCLEGTLTEGTCSGLARVEYLAFLVHAMPCCLNIVRV